MKMRFFKRWNWEYDYGEEELRLAVAPIPPYAVAYYDGEERLYRVEVMYSGGEGGKEADKLVYDYFCDNIGQVIEKRSLNEVGAILLLVRFAYDAVGGPPKQVAFNPKTGETRSAVRKDYLTRRRAAG
jgi:hypothetical protein